METKNQKKAVGKTIGFSLIVVGLIYLGFFLFSQDHMPPVAALASVALGVILMLLFKRW